MGSTDSEKFIVTADWKKRVKAELDARGRGAYTRAAEAIGCRTGQLSELLAPESRYSHLVPAIHQYFGWDLPTPPIPGSRETGTIRYLQERLTDDQLRFLLDLATAINGATSGDQRRYILDTVSALRHGTDEQRRYMRDTANMLTRAPHTDATKELMGLLRAFRSGFEAPRGTTEIVRMVIVESDPVATRTIERSVEPMRERVHVVFAANSADAGLLILAQPPNLVATDATPAGLDLCRKVRSSPETSSVVVVVASGKPSKTVDAAARKAGALRVVQKPIDVNALLGFLASA